MKKNNYPLPRKLNQWFQKSARQLPWRNTCDPYKIWISEVMLQQTTVATVIPYYKKWVKTFPTVDAVAKASLQEILNMWQGLGYYQRAKNIHRASKVIVSEHNGKIPSTYKEIIDLPGFGPYTAGAVLSIAYDKREPILDANIRRLFIRFHAIMEPVSQQLDKQMLEYLRGILPHSNLRTFNQALMELGALVCKSSEPVCSMCPISNGCAAYSMGVQELVPLKKQRLTEELHVVVGIMKRQDKYFIQKRPSKGLLADLWEFPGGKIEEGETADEALSRELKEELNVDVVRSKYLTEVRHFYTKYKVNLYAFECTTRSLPETGRTRKWVRSHEFESYPMPSGSAKLVDFLLNRPQN